MGSKHNLMAYQQNFFYIHTIEGESLQNVAQPIKTLQLSVNQSDCYRINFPNLNGI